MIKIKSIIMTGVFFLLLYSCTPWVSVAVMPENFIPVKHQFDTFIFGSYTIDADQGIYLDMKGAEPDLLLDRVYTHAFEPGKTDYFLIPIPSGNHFVRSVYFTEVPDYSQYYYPDEYVVSGWGWGWGWGWPHYHVYYYEPYPYGYPGNVVKLFRYPFIMNLERNKIYYFGRIVLVNGKFSVENRFDEDKSALEDSVKSDTNAYLELSRSEFANLLK